MLVYIGRKRDMLVYIGLSLLVSSVVGQMHPVPPPPPYNMYGPVNPYMPQPMMPPPMSPYPASTSVSYATYPMIPSAAAPYPAYGIPAPPLQSQPMMYPPPYQTFSGSGPMGDPFTSSTGVCKYTAGSRHLTPIPPLVNGYYKRANMVCTRYS